MRFKHKTLALMGVLLSTTMAQAASYRFITDQGAGGQYSDGTAIITVYLQEVLSASENSVIESHNGLLSAGFSVTRTSGNVSLSLSGDAAFDTPTTSSTGTTWRLLESLPISAESGPTPTGGLIPLGQITLHLPADAIGSSFSIQAYDGFSGNISTYSEPPLALDAVVPTPATFSVAVPEPLSGGLAAMSGILLLRRRPYRRD